MNNIILLNSLKSNFVTNIDDLHIYFGIFGTGRGPVIVNLS